MAHFTDHQQHHAAKQRRLASGLARIEAGFTDRRSYQDWVLRFIEVANDSADLAILEYCRGADGASLNHWREVVAHAEVFFSGAWTRMAWPGMHESERAAVIDAFDAWEFGHLANHCIIGSLLTDQGSAARRILSHPPPCGSLDDRLIQAGDLALFTLDCLVDQAGPRFARPLAAILRERAKFHPLAAALAAAQAAGRRDDPRIEAALCALSGSGGTLFVHWLGVLLQRTGACDRDSVFTLARLQPR